MAACGGTNKRGEPCRAAALRGSDFCAAHDRTRPEDDRFGSSQWSARAGASEKPRVPKLHEVLTERVEEEADRIVGALFEALDATQGVAIRVGRGQDAIVDTPDYATRIRAAQILADRILGKPRQQTEITGVGGGPVEIVPVRSDRASVVADLLNGTGAIRPPVTNGNGNGHHG